MSTTFVTLSQNAQETRVPGGNLSAMYSLLCQAFAYGVWTTQKYGTSFSEISKLAELPAPAIVWNTIHSAFNGAPFAPYTGAANSTITGNTQKFMSYVPVSFGGTDGNDGACNVLCITDGAPGINSSNSTVIIFNNGVNIGGGNGGAEYTFCSSWASGGHGGEATQNTAIVFGDVARVSSGVNNSGNGGAATNNTVIVFGNITQTGALESATFADNTVFAFGNILAQQQIDLDNTNSDRNDISNLGAPIFHPTITEDTFTPLSGVVGAVSKVANAMTEIANSITTATNKEAALLALNSMITIINSLWSTYGVWSATSDLSLFKPCSQFTVTQAGKILYVYKGSNLVGQFNQWKQYTCSQYGVAVVWANSPTYPYCGVMVFRPNQDPQNILTLLPATMTQADFPSITLCSDQVGLIYKFQGAYYIATFKFTGILWKIHQPQTNIGSATTSLRAVTCGSIAALTEQNGQYILSVVPDDNPELINTTLQGGFANGDLPGEILVCPDLNWTIVQTQNGATYKLYGFNTISGASLGSAITLTAPFLEMSCCNNAIFVLQQSGAVYSASLFSGTTWGQTVTFDCTDTSCLETLTYFQTASVENAEAVIALVQTLGCTNLTQIVKQTVAAVPNISVPNLMNALINEGFINLSNNAAAIVASNHFIQDQAFMTNLMNTLLGNFTYLALPYPTAASLILSGQASATLDQIATALYGGPFNTSDTPNTSNIAAYNALYNITPQNNQIAAAMIAGGYSCNAVSEVMQNSAGLSPAQLTTVMATVCQPLENAIAGISLALVPTITSQSQAFLIGGTVLLTLQGMGFSDQQIIDAIVPLVQATYPNNLPAILNSFSAPYPIIVTTALSTLINTLHFSPSSIFSGFSQLGMEPANIIALFAAAGITYPCVEWAKILIEGGDCPANHTSNGDYDDFAAVANCVAPLLYSLCTCAEIYAALFEVGEDLYPALNVDELDEIIDKALTSVGCGPLSCTATAQALYPAILVDHPNIHYQELLNHMVKGMQSNCTCTKLVNTLWNFTAPTTLELTAEYPLTLDPTQQALIEAIFEAEGLKSIIVTADVSASNINIPYASGSLDFVDADATLSGTDLITLEMIQNNDITVTTNSSVTINSLKTYPPSGQTVHAVGDVPLTGTLTLINPNTQAVIQTIPLTIDMRTSVIYTNTSNGTYAITVNINDTSVTPNTIIATATLPGILFPSCNTPEQNAIALGKAIGVMEDDNTAYIKCSCSDLFDAFGLVVGWPDTDDNSSPDPLPLTTQAPVNTMATVLKNSACGNILTVANTLLNGGYDANAMNQLIIALAAAGYTMEDIKSVIHNLAPAVLVLTCTAPISQEQYLLILGMPVAMELFPLPLAVGNYELFAFETNGTLIDMMMSGTLSDIAILCSNSESNQPDYGINAICCEDMITIYDKQGAVVTLNWSSGSVVETDTSIPATHQIQGITCCGDALYYVIRHVATGLFSFVGAPLQFGSLGYQFVSTFCCNDGAQIFVLLKDAQERYFLYQFAVNDTTGEITQDFTSFQYEVFGDHILFLNSVNNASATAFTNYAISISEQTHTATSCAQAYASGLIVEEMLSCGTMLFSAAQDLNGQLWLYAFNAEGVANPAFGFPIGQAGSQLISIQCCPNTLNLVIVLQQADGVGFDYLSYNLAGQSVTPPVCGEACFPTLSDFETQGQYAKFLLRMEYYGFEAFAALTPDQTVLDVIVCDLDNNGTKSVVTVTQDAASQLFATLYTITGGPYVRLLGSAGTQYYGAFCSNINTDGSWSVLLVTQIGTTPYRFTIMNRAGQLESLCPEAIITCVREQFVVLFKRRDDSFMYYFTFNVTADSTVWPDSTIGYCDDLIISSICDFGAKQIVNTFCCVEERAVVVGQDPVTQNHTVYFIRGNMYATQEVTDYVNSFCCDSYVYVMKSNRQFEVFNAEGESVSFTVKIQSVKPGSFTAIFTINEVPYTLLIKDDGTLLKCSDTAGDSTTHQSIECNNEDIIVEYRNGRYWVSGHGAFEEFVVGNPSDVLAGLWCCSPEALVLMQSQNGALKLYLIETQTGNFLTVNVTFQTSCCLCGNDVNVYTYPLNGQYHLFTVGAGQTLGFCPVAFGSTTDPITQTLCRGDRIAVTTASLGATYSQLYLFTSQGQVVTQNVPLRNNEPGKRFVKRVVYPACRNPKAGC